MGGGKWGTCWAMLHIQLYKPAGGTTAAVNAEDYSLGWLKLKPVATSIKFNEFL